ncbi:MAG: hypothetical protein IPG93_24650 [Burkholderiales bacterium]|nr:hypothetical protein [Burkholderiales bacterium]
MQSDECERTYDPSGGEPVKLGQYTLEMLTDKAIQVTSSKGLKHWIPMSAIHDDSEIYGRDTDGKQQARGSEGVLVVKRWLARERGWTKE